MSNGGIDTWKGAVHGLAVQERLEKIGLALPIVFMTGSVDRIEGGTEDFLKKPVSKDALLDAIERALGSVPPPNNAVPDTALATSG